MGVLKANTFQAGSLHHSTPSSEDKENRMAYSTHSYDFPPYTLLYGGYDSWTGQPEYKVSNISTVNGYPFRMLMDLLRDVTTATVNTSLETQGQLVGTIECSWWKFTLRIFCQLSVKRGTWETWMLSYTM